MEPSAEAIEAIICDFVHGIMENSALSLASPKAVKEKYLTQKNVRDLKDGVNCDATFSNINAIEQELKESGEIGDIRKSCKELLVFICKHQLFPKETGEIAKNLNEKLQREISLPVSKLTKRPCYAVIQRKILLKTNSTRYQVVLFFLHCKKFTKKG